MPKYFVVANSFAAPFFSNQSTGYTEGDTPEEAMLKFVAGYSHPAGLYAAILYASADDYHENREPLARWLCNHEIAKERLTEGLGGYSYLGHAPGDFEIDHVRHRIDDPKGGRLVPVGSED